jgi:hypothetical protein
MYDSKHRTTDTQIYDTRKDGSGYSVRNKKRIVGFLNEISLNFSQQNESGIYKPMDLVMKHQIIENICELNVN